MLARFNVAVKETREFIDVYRFNDGATTLYRFLWGEFCDWGIELSKADKASVAELGSIFKESMKLLHPFMPFITENLHNRLSADKFEDGESIMVQAYPTVSEVDDEVIKQFDLIMEAIVSVRRCKTLVDKGNQKIEKASIKLSSVSDIEMMKPFIEKLGKVEEITFVSEKLEKCVTDVSDNLETFISTDDIDMSAIIGKLTKQKEKLEKEIAKLNGMLNNERFVANAPKKVIADNKKALGDVIEKMVKVEAELKEFKI
ncbi:Valyl-tRNA synthetase [hydrothermal vent metagenome]|uniref:valine--tRNA ligase n=1 Tax=hydrothermal vent metagenome TaxID=652676 RepID=A0A1W1CQG7_9ZZZZ